MDDFTASVNNYKQLLVSRLQLSYLSVHRVHCLDIEIIASGAIRSLKNNRQRKCLVNAERTNPEVDIIKVYMFAQGVFNMALELLYFVVTNKAFLPLVSLTRSVHSVTNGK
jgi:hypothetical protein